MPRDVRSNTTTSGNSLRALRRNVRTRSRRQRRLQQPQEAPALHPRLGNGGRRMANNHPRFPSSLDDTASREVPSGQTKKATYQPLRMSSELEHSGLVSIMFPPPLAMLAAIGSSIALAGPRAPAANCPQQQHRRKQARRLGALVHNERATAQQAIQRGTHAAWQNSACYKHSKVKGGGGTSELGAPRATKGHQARTWASRTPSPTPQTITEPYLSHIAVHETRWRDCAMALTSAECAWVHSRGCLQLHRLPASLVFAATSAWLPRPAASLQRRRPPRYEARAAQVKGTPSGNTSAAIKFAVRAGGVQLATCSNNGLGLGTASSPMLAASLGAESSPLWGAALEGCPLRAEPTVTTGRSRTPVGGTPSQLLSNDHAGKGPKPGRSPLSWRSATFP